MRLFHVSKSGCDITAFRPFTHFGRAEAALARSGSFASNWEQNLAIYEVEFTALKPLRIKDLNDKLRSNNHGLVTLTDCLHYDAGVLKAEERAMIFRSAAPACQNQGEGLVELARILKGKGFDSIVYRNDFEAAGLDSWMNITCDQVKIISVMSSHQFVEHFASQKAQLNASKESESPSLAM